MSELPLVRHLVARIERSQARRYQLAQRLNAQRRAAHVVDDAARSEVLRARRRCALGKPLARLRGAPELELEVLAQRYG